MRFLDNLFKGNTLYYPGCLTKFAAPLFLGKYRKILQLEKIDFIELKEKENCCGSPIKNAGAQSEFKGLAKKNLALFKEHGISQIITNCPGCALVFSKNYPKILGEDWDIKAYHITQVFNKSLENIQKVPGKPKATFHDPCHLGRGLGIYEKPRELIKKAGYELVEMPLCKGKSFCCGAGGGVRTNDPDLSEGICQDRIKQAKETGAEVIFTNCPMCVAQLKEGGEGKIEAKDIVELFNL